MKAKTQKAQKRPTISALSARKLALMKSEREQNMQRRADRIRKGEIPLLSYYGLKTYLKGDKVRFESQEWVIKKLGSTINLENEEYALSLTVADLKDIAERRQVAVKKAKRTLLGVLKEGYDEIVFRSDRAMKTLLGSSVNA